MRYLRSTVGGAAILAALLLAATTADAIDLWPFGSPSLRVTPPRMLYWGNYRGQSDAYGCEVLRTSEIVEADEASKARLLALPCGQAYGGKWLRYTVMVTWRCPGNSPGQPCPYAKNTLYGFSEEVPDAALLTHLRAGAVDCTDASGPRHLEWKAGDPWDILHTVWKSYPTLCDNYYGRRLPGTHLLPDPGSAWAREAMKRYAAARVAQGYSFARIDETYLHDRIDWSDIRQYAGETPEQNFARFKNAEAAALAGMRTVSGWVATCPSQHEPWGADAMKLNRAGGCASAEGAPGGGGIRANMGRETVAQLRARYGRALQNPEPDTEVPNNILLALRYETTERNVRVVSQVVKQARVSNSPNLYWLLDCPDIVTAYGADFQDAIGYGGDVVICIDHWGNGRNPNTGQQAPWWISPTHKPTWAQ